MALNCWLAYPARTDVPFAPIKTTARRDKNIITPRSLASGYFARTIRHDIASPIFLSPRESRPSIQYRRLTFIAGEKYKFAGGSLQFAAERRLDRVAQCTRG